MYDPKRTKSRKSEIFNILKSNVVGILYCVAFLFLFAMVLTPVCLLLFCYAEFYTGSFIPFCTTTLLRKIRRKGMNHKHILLIGYSRAAEGYIDRLLAHPEWGISIHGILDNHKPLGYSYRDIHVIGRVDELEKMLSEMITMKQQLR